MVLKKIKYIIKNWILPPVVYDLLKKKRPRPAFNQLTENTKAIKDRHVGKRCFIVGAGSSIKQQDLKKLAGEYVISVSNTFVHPDYHIFKPQYHVLPDLAKGHRQYFTDDKFISWLKDVDLKTHDAEIFLHYYDKKMIDEHNIFKNRKIHWVDYWDWDLEEGFNNSIPIDPGRIPPIYSVSELAVTLAVFMGFDKIYLLGFDHDFFNGVHVYFFDKRKEHKLHTEEVDLSKFDSEFQLTRHAYIMRKYKYLFNMKKNIYNANANQNTYVDVFPKVDFDSLFD